jgi:hypothetical protein
VCTASWLVLGRSHVFQLRSIYIPTLEVPRYIHPANQYKIEFLITIACETRELKQLWNVSYGSRVRLALARAVNNKVL